MRLKTPKGATHVQTAAKVYEIVGGHIEVEEGSPDLAFFLGNGFSVAPSETGPDSPDPNPKTTNKNKAKERA